MIDIIIEKVHVGNALILFGMGMMVLMAYGMWYDSKIASMIFIFVFGGMLLGMLLVINGWWPEIPIDITFK